MLGKIRSKTEQSFVNSKVKEPINYALPFDEKGSDFARVRRFKKRMQSGEIWALIGNRSP